MKFFYPLLLPLFLSSTLLAQIPAAEAWYPFCGNGTDQSGNSWTATVTNCYIAPNRFGQGNNAYNFPGTGYIKVPSSVVMGVNAYSYSLWILFASNPSTTQCIFSGGGNDIYDQNLLILPSGDLMAVSHNNGNPSASSVSSPTLTPNKWHHVVVLRNSVLMEMYVDNVKYSGSYHNNTSAQWGTSSPYGMYLGMRSNGKDKFIGMIDDARFYYGVLNATQIASLYKEAMFPATIAYGDTICAGESAKITASGATSYTYPAAGGVVKPVTTTTYAVAGQSLGCISTATTQVIVNLCTRLDAISISSEVTLYPNPNNGHFLLSGDFGNGTSIRYTVLDLSGRMVMKGEVFDRQQTEIHTSAAPGTYLLQLYDDKRLLATRKFVVSP